MPAPASDARSCRATVLANARCGEDGIVLRLRPELDFAPIRASRFFMLRREDAGAPLIPRPFSIYRQLGHELEFLIKVVGRGTRSLAAARAGDRLRLTGPLGNGWPTLDRQAGRPWVLLGGGIGSAPFYMGIEQALAGMDGASACRSEDLVMLYGAARRGLLYDLQAFEQLGVRVHAETDDGSHGFHGNVLQLLQRLWSSGELPEHPRLLACGPERMLQAVAALALERQLPCWLSLESYMGCGVGVCNACPVPSRAGGAFSSWSNAKCCVEGPVFDARDVELAHARH